MMGPVAPGGVVVESSGARRTDEPMLDDMTLQRFRELPGVALVTPIERLQGGSMLEYGDLMGYTSIVGVEPAYFDNS